MRPQTLVVVMLALISGMGAVWGVRSTWKKPTVVETVPVAAALVDLRRDEAIDASMVELRRVAKDQAPEGALPSIAEAVGRTTFIPMLKGEFVVEPKLLPKGTRAGMAAMIRPGMRAFTIQTPTFSSSLAGFLQPGNKVDVLLTITPPGSTGDDEATTSTLIQNVELLAVHTMVDAPADNRANPTDSRSVTLLVTPRQASILDLAQNKGTLHLSLRNAKDDSDAEETKATLADLGVHKPEPSPGPVAAAPPPAPDPEPVPVVLSIRTLRGTRTGVDQITVLRGGRARPLPPAPGDVSTVASPGPRRRPG
ncbi:Flp pilus assembly protein CpaB [Paludisphaera mucosa]|uniref:Flp pilus assembly protein CpaB n=1 Tax=Paludisphaera mucosa TaxID=3030827 RepID=A0ABT6FAY7_9BACT|nr:Flp pilus assembly protein CpaB [Paludisphaera mucosa]MDG3004749.1 Flp pilus assembly protein CpaB [Paludisphaera mucosa]